MRDNTDENLTADNHRLRADKAWLQESCGEAEAENSRLRAEVKALAFEEAALKRDCAALTADLARLTHDAAAECGRLRAELTECKAIYESRRAIGESALKRLGVLDTAGNVTPEWTGAHADIDAAADAAVAACAPKSTP